MYYSLHHWIQSVSPDFQDDMKTILPKFFIPGKDECFLKVPDTHTSYIFQALMDKYDVMIMDRSGKPYMYLDVKNKRFSHR